MLVMVTFLSMLSLPASAASIADGSKSCTVSIGERNHYLTTTAGTALGATSYQYTTNDGLTGPAYCIDHGLGVTTASLPITGRYTSSPPTAGAFANGYPQHSLETFLWRHLERNPILSGLTEKEYAYATQIAVWATLGQISVEGTQFTSGREKIVQPSGDTQQMRVFKVIQLILADAAHWDRIELTGMYIRIENDVLGGNISIPANMTLAFAAERSEYGLKCETIDGVSYYTREYIFASATSTYYNDYTIELWAEGAPAGVMFVDTDNNQLQRSTWRESPTWRLPVSVKSTDLNTNGYEYVGTAKLCIPAENVPNSGEITIRSAAQIMQYEIYLAYNSNASKQSYIIADPSKGVKEANATLSWGSELTETGELQISKVNGTGTVLPGASFTLTGTDGSTRTGTTNEQGIIRWTGLDPNITYTLTETEPPAGYTTIDPITLTIQAARVNYVTVQNSTMRQLIVRKVDKQTGYSLVGAHITFEQIDGSFQTTKITDHAGMIAMTADELPVGSYKVYEVTAPEGYELDSTVQTVNWTGANDITLTFNNVRKPTLIIYKCDEGNNFSLPDASFEVFKNGVLFTTVTTNDNGLAYVPGVTSGYYTIKEKTPPPGYVLDTKVHEVTIDTYNPATTDDPRVVITNAAKPGLLIQKYDAATNRALPDCTFEVYKDATLIGTYTTDRSGQILLTELDPGTYLVKEIAATQGYVVNSSPQQIEIAAGQGLARLVFLNELKPGIHLVKLDRETLDPLVNAKFKIERVGGTFSREYTTNADGEVDLSALEPGAYEVTEILAPSGYLIDDAKRIVQVNAGENAVFVFTDTAKPSLKVVKYDPHKDVYLSGATFRVAKIKDGSHYLDRITDVDGSFTITGLEPGVYSVQEISPPGGYVLDTTEYHVELFPGETSQLVVTNSAKPDLEIVKTDAETGLAVEGVTFTVRKIDSSTVTTVTTNVEGKAYVQKLEPGVYEVIEQSVPDNYLLDSKPQQVTLEANRTATVRFQNHVKPTLEILKTDPDGNPIEGAVFRIKVKNGDVIGDYTTDKYGRITVDKLLPQYYTVTEISVPATYVLNTHPRDVLLEAGKTTSITIENKIKPGLTILKVDSVTGSPIKGARFQVWYAGTGAAAGTLTDKGYYYSDADGKIVMTGLAEGWYRVTELEPATGYELKAPSTQDVYVKANAGATLTFENIPKSAIVIVKRDGDTGEALAGAKFQLRYFSGVSGTGGTVIGTYETNYNGAAIITGLKAGTYVAEELQAPENYVISGSPQTIYVTGLQQDVVTVEFLNYKHAGIVIKKLNSVTKEPIAGVTFKVTDSSGAVVGESNGLFTTDESGVIQIPNVPVGSYVVQEYTPAAGYVMDDTEQTVKVERNRTYTLTFYNTPKGSLVINKLDSVTGKPLAGATFKITYSNGQYVDNAGGAISSNGLYTTDKTGQIIITGLEPDTYVVTEVKSPSGYVLDTLSQTVVVNTHDTQTLTFYNTPIGGLQIIKTDEDTGTRLSGVRFEVAEMSGKVIGTYTTDSNGVISLPGLDSGWYRVTETRAKSGYLASDESYSVEVVDGKTATLSVTNKRSSAFLIHKVDSETGRGIYGVRFLISDANNNPVATAVSDQDGYVYLPDLEDGRYTIREIEAAEGYLLDTSVKTFYVRAGSTTQITWRNTPVMGQIQITKKSSDYNSINGFPAGTLLPGATFEIYNRAGRLVDTVVTNKNGVAISDTLPLGRYTIRETVAPAYYSGLQSAIETEIEFSGQIVRLEVLNSSVYTNVSVDKSGYTEVVPGQSIRYNFKNIANNSTVPLDSFYWRDTLPTDAVRLSKIVTGTWSAQLSYKIVFKTNVNSSYRTLADNLSTNRTYTIDASAAALGLASNEYVTEFMFAFGRAPAGFTQVTAPYIYCGVLPGLAHEYRFTNKTDVGGLWGSQWIMSNDRWVTVVYNKTTPPTLPRTGY